MERDRRGSRLPLLPFLRSGSRANPFPLGSGDADPRRDPRLAQPVSLTAEGAPLSDVAAGLSSKTGVRVEAAPEIGDRRVFLRVRARPLGEVLTSLRMLYGLRLLGNDGAYSLEPHPETEALRKKHREEERAALRADLVEIIRWAGASPAERYRYLGDSLQKGARDQYVWVDRLKPEQAWMGLAFGALTSAEFDQVLAGEVLRLPLARLSPAAREQVRADWTQRPVLNGQPPRGEEVDPGWLLLSRRPLLAEPYSRDALFVEGYVPVPAYPEQWARVAGGRLPSRVYSSDTGDTGAYAFLARGSAAKERLAGRFSGDLREPKAPAARKAGPRSRPSPLARALAPLYEDAQFSVIADVTPQPAEVVPRSAWSAQRIDRMLPRFSAATGRYVLQEGETLAFRSFRWYAFDETGAPVARLREWEREREASGGRITSRVARDASAMTPLQRSATAALAPWYAWEEDTLALFRFYGALSPEEQARFFSKDGLPLADASPAAREALRQAGVLLSRDTEHLLRPEGRVSLAMEPDPGLLWLLTPGGRAAQAVPFVLKPAAQPLRFDLSIETGEAAAQGQ